MRVAHHCLGPLAGLHLALPIVLSKLDLIFSIVVSDFEFLSLPVIFPRKIIFNPGFYIRLTERSIKLGRIQVLIMMNNNHTTHSL